MCNIHLLESTLQDQVQLAIIVALKDQISEPRVHSIRACTGRFDKKILTAGRVCP